MQSDSSSVKEFRDPTGSAVTVDESAETSNLQLIPNWWGRCVGNPINSTFSIIENPFNESSVFLCRLMDPLYLHLNQMY